MTQTQKMRYAYNRPYRNKGQSGPRGALIKGTKEDGCSEMEKDVSI